VNLYKNEYNEQFDIHSSICLIKFQSVLHVSALFPVIIRHYTWNILRKNTIVQ